MGGLGFLGGLGFGGGGGGGEGGVGVLADSHLLSTKLTKPLTCP